MNNETASVATLKSTSCDLTAETVRTRALDNVDFQINEGELVSIVGPSGAGKSTLLSLLGLLRKPTSGDVTVFGRNSNSLTQRTAARIRLQSIGFVFQNFDLLESLTVEQNIALPLRLQRKGRDEISQAVDRVLAQLSMSHRAKHFPLQLSGGQQQRVAIARAAITEPKLVLADEPTGNLDMESTEQVLDMLRAMSTQGCAVCIVTHDREVAEIAGSRYSMNDGKLSRSRQVS